MLSPIPAEHLTDRLYLHFQIIWYLFLYFFDDSPPKRLWSDTECEVKMFFSIKCINAQIFFLIKSVLKWLNFQVQFTCNFASCSILTNKRYLNECLYKFILKKKITNTNIRWKEIVKVYFVVYYFISLCIYICYSTVVPYLKLLVSGSITQFVETLKNRNPPIISNS